MARKAYNLKMAMECPGEVEELYIYRRNLEEIPKHVYKLKHLKKLDFSGNKLSQIPTEIQGLKNLETLNLSSNRLHQADFSFLRKLPLKELCIADNGLKNIPEDIFLLEKLEELHISQNKITHIPFSIGYLVNLKILSLNDNLLTELPNSLESLLKLEKIFLDKNNFTSIPDILSSLTKLSRITLFENRIQSVSPDFKNLNSLRSLTLSIDEKFDGSSVFQHLNLREISISGNKKAEIPDCIFNAKNTSFLSLEDFTSTVLSSRIKEMKNLNSLSISGTPIKTLPISITRLEKLSSITFEKTSLNEIPSFLFRVKKLSHIKAEQRLKPHLFNQIFREFSGFTRGLKETIYLIGAGIKSLPLELTKWEIFYLLNYKFKKLESNVIQYIYQEYSLSIKDFPLRQSTHLTILGKTHLNLKKIIPQLKNAGIIFSKTITPETTHVVLGKQPKEIEKLATRDFVFVHESELTRWLQEQEKPYLLSSSQEELENLSRLLLSFQPNSIDLALQLMETGGVPNTILTDLVIAFKKLKAGKQKRMIRKLLSLHLSPKALEIVSLKTGLLEKGRVKEKIRVMAEGTELETAKLILYL